MVIPLHIALFSSITALTLLLSLYEFYPKVRSVKAIFTTFSYWLLLSAKVLVNAGAAYLIKFVLFPQLGVVETILVTMLASVSIIENFTIKIADTKPVDVSALVDTLRTAVLEDISARKALLTQRSVEHLSLQLARLYHDREDLLQAEYKLMLLSAGVEEDDLNRETEKLEQICAEHQLDFARVLAGKIAEFDMAHARELLGSRDR
jgi:hypothetical protein